jgi:chromosome segregation ATPase
MRGTEKQENETPEIREVLSTVVHSLDRLELGQMKLQEDVQGLRVQMFGMEGEIRKVQARMTGVEGEVSGIRQELVEVKGSIFELGAELRGEIGDLRTEVTAEFQSLSESDAEAILNLDERFTVLEVRQA